MSEAWDAQTEWREQAMVAGLLAVVLWLIQHGFPGVYHDAGVHALLAAHWLYPEAYAADPFFLFGSQGDWSLFPGLQGVLISLLGFDLAAQAIVLAGAAMWIVAASMLAEVVLPKGFWRLWAFLLIATATWSYSPNFESFRLNESFATARSIAMPLALAATAAFLGNRLRAAWILALAATLFHPLIGGWVLGWLVLDRITLQQAALVVPVAVAATLVSVWLLPFSGLATMDAEWEGGVRALTRDLLVGPVGTLRLSDWLTTVGALWWSSRRLSGSLARRAQVLALIAAWALLLATVVSHQLPAATLVSLQTWRVVWLAQPVAALLAIAVVAGWATTPTRRWVVAGVTFVAWRFDLLVALIVALGLHDRIPALRRLRQEIVLGCQKRARWFVAAALGAVALLLPGLIVDLAIAGDGLREITWWRAFPEARGLALAGGCGIGLLIWALVIGQRWPRRLLCLALVPAGVWAVETWDTRPEALRVREAGYLPGVATLLSRSPVLPGESVAIDGNVPFVVWFWLGAVAYAEPEQAIGAVFSRERWQLVGKRLARVTVAGSLNHRLAGYDTPERVLAIRRQDLRRTGQDVANLHAYKPASLRFTAEGVDYLCEDPALDWVLQRVDDLLAGETAVEIPGAGSYRAIHCVTRRGKKGGLI